MGRQEMNALQLDQIGHAFFGRTVLDRVELAIAPREIVALVGPSGCGKSTLLHIALGLIEPLRGRVRRDYRRHGVVFQDARLLPWANARDNIAYPLRAAGGDRHARRGRAETAARQVAFAADDLDKFPIELSGGMRQRVAIARALAVEPDFLYLDEPFTALDVALKRRMQDLVIEAAQTASFAALFVTHDLLEAARIAHRIAVLDACGDSVAGVRTLPGAPGSRDARALFELTQHFECEDPLFRHIHDVDERRAT